MNRTIVGNVVIKADAYHPRRRSLAASLTYRCAGCEGWRLHPIQPGGQAEEGDGSATKQFFSLPLSENPEYTSIESMNSWSFLISSWNICNYLANIII